MSFPLAYFSDIYRELSQIFSLCYCHVFKYNNNSNNNGNQKKENFTTIEIISLDSFFFVLFPFSLNQENIFKEYK